MICSINGNLKKFSLLNQPPIFFCSLFHCFMIQFVPNNPAPAVLLIFYWCLIVPLSFSHECLILPVSHKCLILPLSQKCLILPIKLRTVTCVNSIIRHVYWIISDVIGSKIGTKIKRDTEVIADIPACESGVNPLEVRCSNR